MRERKDTKTNPKTTIDHGNKENLCERERTEAKETPSMNDDSHGDIFGDSSAAADVAAIDAIMDGAERKKENKASG